MATADKPPLLSLQTFPLCLSEPSSPARAPFSLAFPYPSFLLSRSLSILFFLIFFLFYLFIFSHQILHSLSSQYDQTILRCSFSPISPLHTSLHLHMYLCHISHKCFHCSYCSILTSFSSQIANFYKKHLTTVLYLRPLFTCADISFITLASAHITLLHFTTLFCHSISPCFG